MCQLNSYFVPKILSKSKVLEIMQAAGMDCCEYMSDYESMPEFKEYNAFFAAPQRCNCGSVISRLQDTDYKSFDEFKDLSVQREVAELEKIRDFMLIDGYIEKRIKFENKRNEISEKIMSQNAWISEKEKELTDKIMLKTDISDEEKSRLMHENVYLVIHKLLEENEKNPLVVAAREEYQQFIAENKLMCDSSVYTLENVEPQIFPTVPLTLKTAIELSGYAPENADNLDRSADLYTNDEVGEPLTITLPSNNIFDVIEATKNKGFMDCIFEFEAIERFIKAVLVYVDNIKLFAYWQADDCNITETRTIEAKNLTIDNLLFLPHLTLLEIRKTA